MTHDERILELISAYIDGELSADERARVDQLLAADAELRAYHQQLLGVRERVAHLPTYQLPDSFAEAVMRRAEREMLAAKPTTAHAADADQRAANASRSTHVARTSWSRMWIAVATIAGSLLLSVAAYTWWKQRHPQQPEMVEDQRPGNSNLLVNNNNNGASGQPGVTAQGPGDSAISSNTSNNDPTNNNNNNNNIAAGNDSHVRRPPQPDRDPRPMPNNSSLVDSSVAPENTRPGTAAEAGIPMMTLVVDLVIPDREVPRSSDQLPEIFLQSLEGAGVRLQNAIPVDAQMEPALLAHRYFGATRPEDLPQPMPQPQAEQKKYLQLVFVVAGGRQFDEVIQKLTNAEQSGGVLSTRLDLAMGERSSQLFVHMERLSNSVSEVKAQQVRAHPLAMEEELRARLLQALQATEWKEGPQDMVPELYSPNAPRSPDDPPPPPETPPAADAVAAMEEQLFQVLFVVRSESTVRKSETTSTGDDDAQKKQE